MILKKINLKDSNEESDYVEATQDERISMVWEITKDAWAFMRENNAEQRLQRNITNFIKRKS